MTEALIAEITVEAETTRRVFERVPEEHLGWSPHDKSMSLGQLALHIAALPGAIAQLVDPPAAELPAVPLPEAESRDELFSALDESVRTATERLAAWSEDGLKAEWQGTQGGSTILSMPRGQMVRSVMLNHWYHHRGQLMVYLRLLDVPLPPVYGPTADESPFG